MLNILGKNYSNNVNVKLLKKQNGSILIKSKKNIGCECWLTVAHRKLVIYYCAQNVCCEKGLFLIYLGLTKEA